MTTFEQKNKQRLFKVLVLFLVLSFSIFNTTQAQQAYHSAPSYASYESIPSYTEEDIKARLSNLNLCIPPKYDGIVKSYVKTYMVSNRAKARAIVGRTVRFFPIFEKYLKERNLPDDLKFVSVLESGLNPNAVSRSNAVGLWQFMAPTAKGYDLQINSTVDERKDPHRSTQAALRYLKKLHDRYGDWALALAAYNGGPGRVNKAIKRGRSKNFWQIRKYLPKETRNYVPAFFAAAYLINYYQDHGITGDYPDLDMQLTDVIKVYQRISFTEIANITGIPVHTIEALNPSYNKYIIPSSYTGNYLILPQRVMGTFVQFLNYPDSQQSVVYSSSGLNHSKHPNEHFFKTKYIVQANDNIHNLAGVFKCSSYNIRAWNNLGSDYIHPGQELKIYQPFVSTEYKSEFLTASTSTFIPEPTPKPQAVLRKYNTIEIASLPLNAIDNKPFKQATRSLESLSKEAFVYYRVLKGESLSEVASRFPGVSLQNILDINDFSKNKRSIKPGSRIRIKVL